MCDYKDFYEFQGPCIHVIIACQYNREDPFNYFLEFYTLKVYRLIYERPMPPILIENLASDSTI